MRTYSEVISYLYNRLPIFQRVGAPAYKAGLDNIIALCNALGNPQNKVKYIHIAGTNGKGSVSHYLASILQSAGYKNVGLHTSPHLKDFRERIKINGIPIPEQDVIDFVNTHRDIIEKIDCSFFELSVAMTFQYFAEKKCEIAILETGLGGRLDSTNIVNPLVSVITNISLDHMFFLGNSLDKIAYEKAGIIKPNAPVVIGETHEETELVFLEKAKECKSPIYFADTIYKPLHPTHENRPLPPRRGKDGDSKMFLTMEMLKDGKPYLQHLSSELNGSYQLKNIPTVLATVDVLHGFGYKISEEYIKDGIAKVVTQTGLLGRWQILSNTPLTIADTGHNEAGIKAVLAQIASLKLEQLHFVFGVVNDKDVSSVLKLLPKKATYYFCKANIPRALDEKELAKQASSFDLKGECFATVKEALQQAQKKAGKNDLVFIGGSTFVVAEAI